MKKSILTAGVLSLFSLMACSDDQTAGNAVEPNGIADLSSSSDTTPDEISSSSEGNSSASQEKYSVNIDKIFKFTTAPTARTQTDYVSLETYGEENAASASCITKGEQELKGVIKINDGLITRAFSGRNLKVDTDKLIYMFQKTCVHGIDDLDIVADTLTTIDKGFDYVCITESEYMSIDETLGLFDAIMPSNCKQLQIKESLDSLDSIAASKPSTIIFPEEDPDTISIDTTSRTLATYAAQYARPEDLSFDKHVMAYNSYLSNECFKAMDRFKESDISIRFDVTPIMSLERDDISTCFPTTASVGHFTQRDASCKYYIVGVNDGAQPTGHVLSKVARDTIETINISPSGTCAQTCEYFTVYFLIEDCEDIINENTIVSHRGAKSSRWRCEETNPDQSINVRSYGEWYSESL